MSKTSRRAHCEAVADQLDIPRPFDLDTLCARIASRRGRPLRLVPLDGVPDAATPCGVWVATSTTDLIFYEPATSSVHKLHIVLHEIAHLLLGHGATDRERPAYAERLLNGTGAATGADPAPKSTGVEDLAGLDEDDELDLGQLLHVLGRTSYTDVEERDAELLATILSDRALSADAAPSRSEGAAGVLDRLNDAFGHRGRR
ncbi:hypothetical protein GL263_26180 [Streptomyces durbertensis]|uniref:IrrE N-terminal-like domain-containing protein n=1 Tax=Streptomyces durbertensis TaxID=2448886 RepID=A0ABR6EPL3_9ACTN|nr:hypothetical protein [Streptomyces durbertensis]MBB1247007.1 hypothetical protein [Streptomyces durbertensis]